MFAICLTVMIRRCFCYCCFYERFVHDRTNEIMHSAMKSTQQQTEKGFVEGNRTGTSTFPKYSDVHSVGVIEDPSDVCVCEV